MIKRAFYSLLLVAMMAVTGCQEKAVIPDDVLVDIFHDAFVVNAYIGETHVNLDSLHVYEPIFQRYGYSAADVVHTVGNFSRRKSVRLGSIVEQAITKLEQDSREFAKKVVILDTIRNVAVRTFKRTIYTDSLIVAKTRADSTKLYIELSPAPRGEYMVTYNYTCGDDLDKNPRNTEFYFLDENGVQRSRTVFSLREKGTINRTIISKENNPKMVLNIGKYADYNSKDEKKAGRPKTQDLEVRNLKIVHKHSDVDAVDSLFKKYVDIKIFADGFLDKKDSLALSSDAAGVPASTASND